MTLRRRHLLRQGLVGAGLLAAYVSDVRARLILDDARVLQTANLLDPTLQADAPLAVQRHTGSSGAV